MDGIRCHRHPAGDVQKIRIGEIDEQQDAVLGKPRGQQQRCVALKRKRKAREDAGIAPIEPFR